ncbi:MAG: hypothetical protein ACM3SV_08205 [Betaproteobacteria bacterium]
MNEPGNGLAAGAKARTTAAWLAYGETLDQSSLFLTLLALCGIFWGALVPAAQVALMLAVAFGALQKIYALRVGFDRRLFADWALRWSPGAAGGVEADLAAFDEALVPMGLRAKGAAPTRGLDERIGGACRLFSKQVFWLLLQFVALAVAGGLGVMPVLQAWPH